MNRTRKWLSAVVLLIATLLVQPAVTAAAVPYPHQPVAVAAEVQTEVEEDAGDAGEVVGEAVTLTATAYCACAQCCGANATGITASGVPATVQHTVAADWSIFPVGTQFYVPAWDLLFTVEDRGGAIDGSRVDIFMETHEEALDFGRQTITALVIPPPER